MFLLAYAVTLRKMIAKDARAFTQGSFLAVQIPLARVRVRSGEVSFTSILECGKRGMGERLVSSVGLWAIPAEGEPCISLPIFGAAVPWRKGWAP